MHKGARSSEKPRRYSGQLTSAAGDSYGGSTGEEVELLEVG